MGRSSQPPGGPRLFVATRPTQIPPGVTRFASVDGQVPGATVVFDHHQSGEAINLDTLPSRFDPATVEGIGTTMADTDAVVSAAVLLVGGTSAIAPRTLSILASACHWCDHLAPHPAQDDAINRLGRGLHVHTTERLRAHRGARFHEVVRELADTLARHDPLPYEAPATTRDASRAAQLDPARLQTTPPVALVDLRGLPPLDPLATYALHRCPVAVTVRAHRRGGHAFTVGVNPHVSHPEDLGPALRAVARAEHTHGPPCDDEAPGGENWGGRAAVFGSPWNYGSRLLPDEVVELVRRSLFASSASRPE